MTIRLQPPSLTVFGVEYAWSLGCSSHPRIFSIWRERTKSYHRLRFSRVPAATTTRSHGTDTMRFCMWANHRNGETTFPLQIGWNIRGASRKSEKSWGKKQAHLELSAFQIPAWS